MTPSTRSQPYHHGDLRNALVDAGVELARQGGPNAIVLREAARRVGVSPNASYRHFRDLPELVDAVAREALNALGDAMQRELGLVPVTGDARADAWARLQATGRAYVTFALEEPGLFRTAFDRDWKVSDVPAGPDRTVSPMETLIGALDDLVAAGLLAAADVDVTRMTAWSCVHGLSELLLGPMSGIPVSVRQNVINATIEQLGTGILSAPGSSA